MEELPLSFPFGHQRKKVIWNESQEGRNSKKRRPANLLFANAKQFPFNSAVILEKLVLLMLTAGYLAFI